MVLDGKKIIRLIPIIDLDVERQLQVRDIRNEPGVRKWMYTDHIITTNEHLRWICGLKQDHNNIVFAVLSWSGDPLGVVSINKIDWQHQRAEWGFYLSESAQGNGLGAALEYAIIDFAFSVLRLEKLNGEVLEGNEKVISLHRKFGFAFEGVWRWHIAKDGKRHNVILIGMTRQEWEESRESIKLKGGWDVEIQWKAPGRPSGIDAIESARARNNVNWMNIMRLALQRSPDTAKQIVAAIHEEDKKILELTRDLVKE